MRSQRGVAAIAVVLPLVGSSASVFAGGVAVREQSAYFQGLSFAGSAAGGRLSSGYWNSAAFSDAASGITMESSYSLIIGDSEVTARDGTLEAGAVTAPHRNIGESTNIARLALVSASYAAYRLNDDLVLGVAVNAPFGLGVEADDEDWGGEYHGRKGKIFTFNINPSVAYDVTPTLSVGIGLQVQYGQIKFKGNPGLQPDHPNAGFEVDDIAFGGTAGVLWKPTTATSIGLGYRSAIKHDMDGEFGFAGDRLNFLGVVNIPANEFGLEGDVTLPEIVTLSLKQAVSERTRLMATVEWTNWSRLTTVNFEAKNDGGSTALVPGVTAGQIVSSFEFNWDDGWFFALGGEYDYSEKITLRGGVAYEISPIRDADQRFALITDTDRFWLSAGGSYKYSEATTIDFAYTHIFFEDGGIERQTTTSGRPLPLIADVEQQADILTAGMKTKW
ncbi:MAG: OmpP1/FadL family transporter [Hyphomicrobium sp.]